METLSGKPLMRRVLASLPVWYSDEQNAVLDAEAEQENHVRVRRHSLAEMHAEMAANPHAQIVEDRVSRPMSVEEVQRSLDWLEVHGWVACEDFIPVDAEAKGTRYWHMTEAGLEELHRPEAAAENVVPGPVALDLQPAVGRPDTEMGVSADA